MAHRSQCSDAGDNPLDPNYLPPHYREEYRLAIDALVEENLESYYEFLQMADVVDFLSRREIKYIECNLQLPQLKAQPELPYLESGSDGSSDTYWPIHSDLDAPGLDLGWPQVHHFIGPTEVTTLVNPSEPDMPSIKEQARRLIKNAQQVIAVVMDMFTDVDIFSDIIDAAMRNVAVYILLDEQNAQHFNNMVLNCRVNLDSIPSMRVRTVSGITYHCRSGKSFKGQMMDRYLLIDCRAVLSGNYSFTWSFEKIHRCIAHLFLGQLVATFDEEFRILYAQSTPLIVENVPAPVEDVSNISSRHYTGDNIPLFRDPRQPLPFGSSYPEDWARQSFEEHMDVDWKKMPPRRQEPIPRPLEHGPVDLYGTKFGPQPLMVDQSYVEQGYPKMPITTMNSTGFKKHRNADRMQGRQGSHQFMQHQSLHPVDTKGRPFRDQYQYPRTGPEPGFQGYDKFRGQGYHQMNEYSDPQGPSDMESLDSYDPVLNYLSSTAAVEEQGSDRFLPPGEVPFGQSNPKRLSIGQPYACQTSPTPTLKEQKSSKVGPSIDRKNPSVKQGLRDWRISSYLSAFDDSGEEDLPVLPSIGTDPFEEPPNPLPHRSSGLELTIPKFNPREFKIPPASRVSQLSCYTKPIVPDHAKKVSEDFVAMEPEAKTTPETPSVPSSNNDEEKAEELDKKELKDVVRREESFRRQYNANIQRSSRLRSSLIFSSQLEQHVSQELKPTPDNDEETSKDKDDRTKDSIAAQVLGKRSSLAREPFEWTGYKKSSSFDSSTQKVPEFGVSASKENIKDAQREESKKEQVDTNSKDQSVVTDVEHGKVTQSEPPLDVPQVLQPNALNPVNLLNFHRYQPTPNLNVHRISKDSQIRTELPKESAATDDEKEDKADKSGGREGVANARSLSRGQEKNPGEREQLLQKLQTMRKERKVYSRFEVHDKS
ncbi:protein FAM83H [Aplochiton taeniatus]